MKRQKKSITLSIIIVTYNSQEYIQGCLNSIYKTLPASNRSEIIILDNNSKDSTLEILKPFFFKIILIKNDKNYGFAKTCNQGIKIARGKYIFFINPDAEVKKNAIENLSTFLQQNPEVGVVGPLILKPDGTTDPWQMGYEKTLWRAFLEEIVEKIVYVFKPRWFLKLAALIDLNYTDHYQIREVDWVSGTALMVRKKVLEKVGRFDERFFLYYEELDLQKRIKRLGWNIYHLPTSVVVHYGKGSTLNVDNSYHNLKIYRQHSFFWP